MKEDVIYVVLLHFPIETLIRCKCLSKKWNHIISHNSSFRQRYFYSRIKSSGTGLHLLGLFFSRSRSKKIYSPVRFLPTSTQGNKLKNGDETWGAPSSFDESLSFMGLGHQTIHIMASSNGFLLCSLEEHNTMNYLICNPITKHWVTLPTPNTTCHLVNHGLFCQPATAYFGFDLVEYKVVRGIWQQQYISDVSNTLMIEIYSSECHQWQVLNLTCSSYFHLLWDNFPAIVNEQGVAYWSGMTQSIIKCIVISDPSRKCLDLIELPGGPRYKGSNSFGESDGLIMYARQDLCELEIWVLDEKNGFTRQWSLKQRVSLQIPLQKYSEIVGKQRIGNFKIVAFHPRNPQLLFLHSYDKMVSYDLAHSKFELVCDFVAQGWPLAYFFFPYIWPHWPPFFP